MLSPGRSEHLLLDPLHLHHPQRLLEADRWAHSTQHSGHGEGDGDCAGIDVAHPGIDKTIDPEERRYVRYYQWVCFCLFFQVDISRLFDPVPVSRSCSDEWIMLELSRIGDCGELWCI